MEFSDAQLRQHVERAAACIADLSDDQRLVAGLMDAHYWFLLTEGEESPRVQEALRLLLSADLRPALRRWYQGVGDNMNPTALEFRERLSELAGERLGR